MQVLISGAGIAGPTLAWFLAKTGARITIVEKSDAILPHGQTIDLKGSGVSVVKKMGLLDQVRRANTSEKGTQFINPKGQPFAPFPIKEGFSASLTSEYEILRGDLAAILYNASKDLPGVNYLFGTTIKEVIQNDDDDDDGIKVKFNHGDLQDFDLLVAADGQWSKIRQQCFPAEDTNVVNTGMYAAYWTVPRLPSDNDWCSIYLALQSKLIALRPDSHGTMKAFFTRVPCNDVEKKAWLEASKNGKKSQIEILRKDFADAGWQAQRFLDAVDQAPDFYFQNIQQIRMSKWSKTRVVCLGDAGYAPSPLTGEGTTLAIIGAYVLAGELSKLAELEHPSKALEAYERAFRPFVEEAQKIPPFVPGIAHPQTAGQRWMLQTAIWALSKVLAQISKIPRLAKKFDHNNKEDFPLPLYPRFDTESSPTITSGDKSSAQDY